MNICLVPRSKPQHGQDFRQLETINHLNLISWQKDNNNNYSLPNWEKVKLISCFNPHEQADTDFIHLAPKNIPVIIHHQLRFNYLSQQEQKNLQKNLERANRMIIPATFLADEINISCNKLHTVTNGANTKIFKPRLEVDFQLWKKQLTIPENIKIAGFIGSPTDAKGGQFLQAIAKQLQPDWRIVLFSNHEPPNWVNEQENIIYIHQDLNDAKNRHITPLFDCLLSLSLCEVAPMIIIEALLSGIPIIATNSTPYLQELTNKIPNGFLKTLSLPERLNNCSKERLKLESQEVFNLSKTIIASMGKIPIYTEQQRINLSRSAIEARLDSQSMLSGFKDIYNDLTNL